MSPDNDRTLATKIERAVAQEHPDVDLDRFARFYAHDGQGSTKAIYIFANEGVKPIAGKAGEVKWTDLDNLPDVSDGSCNVLNVDYDERQQRLKSVQCNGSGNE